MLNKSTDDLNKELIKSAKLGNTNDINRLLDSGANVDATDINGQTALIAAVINRHLEAIETLIKNHADLNKQDNNGMTALMAAAFNGHSEAIETLIENRADTSKQDNNGVTALMYAVEAGHTAAIETLIKKGAKPNEHDKDGNTALMYAALNNHTETVMILIENGADVNLQDNNDMNALKVSIMQGHEKITETLNHYPNFLKECGFFENKIYFDDKAKDNLRKLFTDYRNKKDEAEVINIIKKSIDEYKETQNYLIKNIPLPEVLRQMVIGYNSTINLSSLTQPTPSTSLLKPYGRTTSSAATYGTRLGADEEKEENHPNI